MSGIKVGSLVRWIHPGDTCFGILLEAPTQEGQSVLIHWLSMKNPHQGRYPLDHHYLEIISK